MPDIVHSVSNISAFLSQTNVHIGLSQKLVLGVYHAMLFPVFRSGAPAQTLACTVPMVRSCFNLTKISCVNCMEDIAVQFTSGHYVCWICRGRFWCGVNEMAVVWGGQHRVET